MSTVLWIALAVAVFVVGYVVAMRNLHRKSREIDKQIDYSKIRPWKDEGNQD
jgi:hypothetical protein